VGYRSPELSVACPLLIVSVNNSFLHYELKRSKFAGYSVWDCPHNGWCRPGGPTIRGSPLEGRPGLHGMNRPPSAGQQAVAIFLRLVRVDGCIASTSPSRIDPWSRCLAYGALCPGGSVRARRCLPTECMALWTSELSSARSFRWISARGRLFVNPGEQKRAKAPRRRSASAHDNRRCRVDFVRALRR